jgi:photosystem II stability/assembly factor-like uncharacterized protein
MGGVALLYLFPLPASAQAGDVPDTPRQRWEYFYEQRAYPFATIPAGALQRAREGLVASRPDLMAAPPPINGTTWAPFGPERIPISHTSTGRLTAIAVHPNDSDIIYVGGAQGGVWKTIDGGTSWMPLTDGQCSLAMGSIAIDPVNPEIVYAGTGEQHFSGSSYYGCGVLRSEDGGATWTQLGAGVFVREGASNARISRIDLDPATAGAVAGTTVLAASDFGLYRSTDGGATWTPVLSGIATDLIRDPTNPQLLYAGIRRVGVSRSIDGGATWTSLTVGLPTSEVGRINLALAPSSPLTLFASIQHKSESDLLGIWKSTDGGDSWAKLPDSAASCGSQCWYNMTIAVHPTDPNTVYFGGVSLFRSTNGGVNFSDIRGGIHVDQHHLTFDPQKPETLFVGNDGGIYVSTNGGGEWTSLNTNLALTQFYSGISLHPWDARVALGGTQDNGTLESTGSFDFNHVLGGDGGFTAIDFLNPSTRYAETQWIAGRSYIGPRRSDGGSFGLRVNGIDTSEKALFIPPLIMDPINPSRLYFGTVRLYRTDDGGENWASVSQEFPGRISAIAPSTSNPAVVYLGTSNGSVQLTTDGGETWREITSGLPNRHVKDIGVDPLDWQRAFLTVSGFGTGHVFRTTDGGGSWQDVSADLPDVPTNALLLDPVQPSTLFVGTDLGVFISGDGGESWTVMNDGLPNVAVFDLAHNPNTGVLLAATHGRGMFSLTLDRELTLAVVPGARVDSLLIGSAESLPDSATVVLTGGNAAGTAWSATSGGAPWLTLTTAGGTGTARLLWTRDPTGLGDGVFIDTIRVTAPGAIDSPFEVIDTLVVLAPRTMTLEPTSRSDTVVVGSTSLGQDSAAITLTGVDSKSAVWQANGGSSGWLNLTTPSLRGSGFVRWTRNPADLAQGTYVDTIVVSSLGALGTPGTIIDSLVMITPLLGLDPTSRQRSAVAGTLDPIPDSARVLLSGVGADTARWNATVSGSSWLSLTAASGTGTGILRWFRDPTGLGVGTHRDTITVEASTGGFARMIDTFTLTAPWVPLQCAVDHLMGAPCLFDLQLRFLDLAGNRDTVYNLGDFLAHLARESVGEGPEGRQ